MKHISTKVFAITLILTFSAIGNAFPSRGDCMIAKAYTSIFNKVDYEASEEKPLDAKLEVIAKISDSEKLVAYVSPRDALGNDNEYYADGNNYEYFIDNGRELVHVYSDSVGQHSRIDILVKDNSSFKFRKSNLKKTAFEEFSNYVVTVDIDRKSSKKENIPVKQEICNTF